MRATQLLCLLCLFVSACASPNPPQPSLNLIYQPGASVKDSTYDVTASHATLCVVLDVDGKEVENSIGASIEASRGRGNVLAVRRIDRQVDIGVHKVTIGCRTASPVPIFDVVNKFITKGTVDFAPSKGHSYLVRGKFEADSASVWIEDETTGVPATTVVTAGK